MRFLLGFHGCLVTAALAASLAACGGDVIQSNTGGGTTTGTTTTSTDTTTTTGSSTSTSTTSSTTTTTTTTACTSPCCLPAVCKAVDKECVGLTDNAGKAVFGLRMSELVVSAPQALTTGIVAGIVAGAVPHADPECNLAGGGTFSWLLEFDTAKAQIRTGGAKPVADPTKGYTFVNELVGGKMVAPLTLTAALGAGGTFTTPQGGNVVMPLYLDAAATQFVLLPLLDLRFTTGSLSGSQNCVGHYNAEGLDVGNSCLPDSQNHSFVTGASLTAKIRLEDADAIPIGALNQTLCVLLANNMGMSGPNGIKVCERDASGQIVFKGDACSSGSGCGDAMSFSADFAASSVVIK